MTLVRHCPHTFVPYTRSTARSCFVQQLVCSRRNSKGHRKQRHTCCNDVVFAQHCEGNLCHGELLLWYPPLRYTCSTDNEQHSLERQLRKTPLETAEHVGADDLLPVRLAARTTTVCYVDVRSQIFTFVVVRANIGCYCFVRDALWSLLSRQALQGQSGYYLTVYESALEFIKSVDPTTGETRL